MTLEQVQFTDEITATVLVNVSVYYRAAWNADPV